MSTRIMSTPRHIPSGKSASGAPGTPGSTRKFGWSAPKRGATEPGDAKKLAHELSNLVDGSLRNLSLAMTRLDDIHETDADDTTDRLAASASAMKQMAELLHRFMDAGRATQDTKPLHWSDATVGEAVGCAMRMVDPIAQQSHITMRADVALLGNLPAGPLYPAIANAIKNAAEAIGENGRIDITGSLDGDRATLRIIDNGPGIGDGVPRDADGMVMAGYTSKRNGHGTGLAVGLEVAGSVGGTMTLNNRPMGGAVCEIGWDVRSIATPQAADGDTK